MTDPLTYKLGKLPAQPDAIKFKFANYFHKPDLPKPPKVFGVWQHFWNINMFQNDRIGDCVLAGAANETASWYHDTRRWVKFTDENVISDYSALSGFTPGNPDSDVGVAMSDAAEYRRSTGVVDHNGVRHKIDAYVALPKSNFDTLKTAMWLFGTVGIGIQVPDYVQAQFAAKEPWSVQPYDRILGGHYIPGCGIDEDGDIVVITWGQYHKMTKEFYQEFNDESCAYFSVERLMNRTSPEGFNADALVDDLKQLKKPGVFEFLTIKELDTKR